MDEIFNKWNDVKKIVNKKEIIENSAMILQLRTFDKNRLMTRIGMINKEDFEKINQKIRRLFIPS